jgi:hypothetical protein
MSAPGRNGLARAHAAALACALIAVALTSDVRVRAQVATRQTLDGTLIVQWGDPEPGATAGGETRFELALPDGRRLRLQLNGQESIATSWFGQRVSITGQLAPSQPAQVDAPDTGTLIVDSITRADSIVDLPPIRNVSGTKRVIFLLAKFSDDVAVPHPPSFFTDLTNPDVPPVGAPFPATINGFFKKTSGNVFSWIGDVGGVGGLGAPGGWLTLPNPRSYYVGCTSGLCANLNAISLDAMALGRQQGIDFTVYDNINFVVSNDLDCCAWGGGFFSAVENKSYGATWEPPWGQDAAVYGHEMGHSIGLPHSGWVYYAYDSPWDVMSSLESTGSMMCGSYNSARAGGQLRTLSCSEPGDGYIGAHKDYLEWIPAPNMVVTDTLSSVTVALEGSSLPLGSAIKLVKICLPGYLCTGTTARYLTVEARVRGLGATSQFDNGIVAEGVLIQEVRRDRPAFSGPCYGIRSSGWVMPIDATAADYDTTSCNTGGRSFPNYGLYNAQFNPGQSYTSIYGVKISVVSRSGSTFVVSVAPAVPVSITPSSTTILPAQNVTLSVSAPGMLPLFYRWFVGSPGAQRKVVPGATSGSYTTPALTASQSYWVQVSDNVSVGDSTSASVNISFADNTLIPGETIVRAVHVTELRARIDALLVRFGRPAWTWTDPALTAGNPINAIHIVDLRNALRTAYQFAPQAPPTFTDPTLGPGIQVKRVHLQEIRDAVNALEAS